MAMVPFQPGVIDRFAMNAKIQSKTEGNPNRRSFLNKLWIGFGLLAISEIIWLVFNFFRSSDSKKPSTATDTVVTAGAVSGFAPESVTAFVRGRFYLARLKDGGFLALSRKCTHLGCTVPWDEKINRFACPCHGSSFDITGKVLEPPASRALDLYRVFIENDAIKVDTGKLIRRATFEPEQVVYTKKI
jgi:cytochrome b6-f complex iron-sulfur subunit